MIDHFPLDTWKNINNHTQIINLIAAKINAQNYLEIGTHRNANNFDKINVPNKIGIDPDLNSDATYKVTSDNYFKNWIKKDEKICIGFVDGLHHNEQATRDIVNVWRHLREGGCVVVHDCNPAKEEITRVPRQTKMWTGDVFISVSRIFKPDTINFFTVDCDYGVFVMRKMDSVLSFTNSPKITWKYFHENRKQLLNLVSVEEAIKIIDGWI